LTDEQLELRRKLKLAALQREADAQAVMATAAGRRFVLRMISACGLGRASYTADPHGRADAFNEGRRDVALKLEHEIAHVCPKDWQLMWSEDIAARAAEIAMQPTPANRPDPEE
jgi:hypothetical protein